MVAPPRVGVVQTPYSLSEQFVAQVHGDHMSAVRIQRGVGIVMRKAILWPQRKFAVDGIVQAKISVVKGIVPRLLKENIPAVVATLLHAATGFHLQAWRKQIHAAGAYPGK